MPAPRLRTLVPVLAVLACTESAPTEDTDPVETGDPLAALELEEILEVEGEHMASSEVCYWCHGATTRSQSMRDSLGETVAPWDLWRGTMMANSARDPLFRATLSVEQATFPDRAEAIGQDCMRCHAPAAFAESTLAGGELPRGDAMMDGDGLGMLARDGVTCVACHMLDPDSAGQPETWSGHHVYDAERRVYGPHEDPYADPMQRFFGYTPVFHENYGQGGMCASCHMLQTETLGSDGQPTGHVLTEQAPFVEWRASDFGRDGPTCQECHLLRTDSQGEVLQTPIARSSFGFDDSSLPARSPYGRHTIVGGNTFGLQLLHDYRDLLGIFGPGPSIEQALVDTRENLARAASLTVDGASLQGGVLAATVTVHNQTGHKLPTGYPTRRVWLEVEVLDEAGGTVLHVGAVDARGRLLGSDGEPLPAERADGPVLGHTSEITSADGPQVWQSVMQTPEGAPTSRLLAGASYAKDDRILPRGYRPTGDDIALTAPVGVAGDGEFGPGQDAVRLRLPVDASGPLTLRLTLRYQAYSPRALDELLAVRTPQTRALEAMLVDRGVPAEVIATVGVRVGDGG